MLFRSIREKFAQDIETYEWAAAHVEAMGGEATRLRPRATIANFKRWTNSELDLRREAASASELAEDMSGVGGYRIPAIDWDRTNGRVMTIEWVDGVKISKRAELLEAEATILKETGQSHRFLAYPYGEFNAQIKAMLVEEGYVGFAQNSGAVEIGRAHV